jgi:hypothetical protein
MLSYYYSQYTPIELTTNKCIELLFEKDMLEMEQLVDEIQDNKLKEANTNSNCDSKEQNETDDFQNSGSFKSCLICLFFIKFF